MHVVNYLLTGAQRKICCYFTLLSLLCRRSRLLLLVFQLLCSPTLNNSNWALSIRIRSNYVLPRRVLVSIRRKFLIMRVEPLSGGGFVLFSVSVCVCVCEQPCVCVSGWHCCWGERMRVREMAGSARSWKYSWRVALPDANKFKWNPKWKSILVKSKKIIKLIIKINLKNISKYLIFYIFMYFKFKHILNQFIHICLYAVVCLCSRVLFEHISLSNDPDTKSRFALTSLSTRYTYALLCSLSKFSPITCYFWHSSQRQRDPIFMQIKSRLRAETLIQIQIQQRGESSGGE